MSNLKWTHTLSDNMDIFDNDDRIDFYQILLSNYNELIDTKNSYSAHKLKSNCLQLGITPIANIAEKIEKGDKFDIYNDELIDLMKYISDNNLFNIS